MISNPVLCLAAGSVILFDVDPVEGRYPVYLKDSILNSNQDFDRAPFDQLASLVANGVQVRTWAHEFAEAGVYVFADSKDKSKLTVVAVKGEGETCKDPDANIQSLTAESLSAIGIESQEKAVQPNWTFIVGAFVVLITFSFGIVGGLVYLRNSIVSKLVSGEGAGETLYYDKVADQEEQDRQQRSCGAGLARLCECLTRGLQDEDAAQAEQKAKGLKYQDLKDLLEEFKDGYQVLRDELEAEQGADPVARDPEVERKQREEALLDERIAALKELKDFVRENQDCLRDYLGLAAADEAEALAAEDDRLQEQRRQAEEERRAAAEVIARSQEREEEFENQLQEQLRALQEEAFTQELVDNE